MFKCDWLVVGFAVRENPEKTIEWTDDKKLLLICLHTDNEFL